MALYKPIKQPDGVVTNYHRVLFIQITTNQQNSIAVLSYVDDQSRSVELNDIDDSASDQSATCKTDYSITPYRQSVTYETDYCPSMTVELAYEYLKTLPQFEGATDI